MADAAVEHELDTPVPDGSINPEVEDSDDDFEYEEVEVGRWVISKDSSKRCGVARDAAASACCVMLHSCCFEFNTCHHHHASQLQQCCSDEEDDDISEDLDAALRSLQALTSKVSPGYRMRTLLFALIQSILHSSEVMHALYACCSRIHAWEAGAASTMRHKEHI
jgi:hypothetical protein